MAARKRTQLPVGRPTLYRKAYNEKVYKLCLLGATDKEIADLFGVSTVTLNAWKKQYPEFLNSMDAGKVEADANVAHSLYHRSLGYSHPAVKVFMPAGADEPVYAPYTEHYPPDTNAASLWLRNRQPERWRGNNELGGAAGATTPPTPDADLRTTAQRLMAIVREIEETTDGSAAAAQVDAAPSSSDPT